MSQTTEQDPVLDPSSVGIYIHVPFCKHACPYCDFYKIELRDRSARARLDFPQQLTSEVDLLVAQHPELSSRPLDTIYFGGGTPSTLVPEAVGNLIGSLRERFTQAESEVTLEANPENLTRERARKWHVTGINRLSIGVQSFHEEDLVLLERLHRPQTIMDALANARAAGFDNVSLDLMFALPGQTMDKWEENLRRAVELEPQHLSFYGLTYHERTPFEEWLRAGRLEEIDGDAQAEMYLRGAEFLESHGYQHYEISNFARPGFRSRHNQRYWTQADVVGLGPGAHSNLADARWANPDDLDAWAATLVQAMLPRMPVETLTPRQAAEERLFTALRRREGLTRDESPELFEACLNWLQASPEEARGWMIQEAHRVRLTREGWLLSDQIIARIVKLL